MKQLTLADALAEVSGSGDPLALAELLWPAVEFYGPQIDMIESVRDAKETYVVAGNTLGKDFVSGFIALSFFMAPQLYFPKEYIREVESWRSGQNPFPHTRKVVTTSVKAEHLKVLWGEIGRFVTGVRVPLLAKAGGPLVMGHQEVRFAWEKEAAETNVLNRLWGMVSKTGEGMSGHYAAYTLVIGDEASGLDDDVYTFAQPWAKRQLWFGNPNETQNFYRRGVEAGSVA